MFSVASSSPPPPPNDVSRECTSAASCVITCRGQQYDIKFKHELFTHSDVKTKMSYVETMSICLCSESVTILCMFFMKFGTGVLGGKLSYIKIGSGAVKLYLRV